MVQRRCLCAAPCLRTILCCLRWRGASVKVTKLPQAVTPPTKASTVQHQQITASQRLVLSRSKGNDDMRRHLAYLIICTRTSSYPDFRGCLETDDWLWFLSHRLPGCHTKHHFILKHWNRTLVSGLACYQARTRPNKAQQEVIRVRFEVGV